MSCRKLSTIYLAVFARLVKHPDGHTLGEWKKCRPLWFSLPSLCRVFAIFSYLLLSFLRKRWVFDPQRIHVIILVRDLFSALPALIDAFLEQGVLANNIIILDLGSSALPCLDTLTSLEQFGCSWIRLSTYDQSFGPYTPWLSSTVKRLVRSWRYPYVITDPDLFVPSQIPADWLSQLFETLCSKRFALKVALPLSIDKISVENSFSIISHERDLVNKWPYRLLTRLLLRDIPGAYVCPTDTTLAIYRPSCFFSTFSIRLSADYQVEHLPWDSDFCATPEFQYYKAHKLTAFGQWSSTLP